MTDFTHLHVHTEYSLLDGAARVADVVERAKSLNMDTLAITDHGVMYGAIDFYKAAKKAGIKPIIGCEVYVAQGSRKEKFSDSHKYAHLVLLCKNTAGYKNLMKLVSEAYATGFYYKPRVDYDLLAEYSDGLIALSGCLAGDIQRMLSNGEYNRAKELSLRLKDIYGEDFYMELQDHGILEQRRVTPLQLKLCAETGIKPVATNDVHYVNKADAAAHDILLCIQTSALYTETNRMSFDTNEFYLKSGDEMASLFQNTPEAILNTREIANKCNLEFQFDSYHLPKFDVPAGETNFSYLKKIGECGLRQRYGENITDEIKARFEYEIATIRDMGFTDYFLVVWDYVRFAKEAGIPVGPGRGSAAGSIVAYSLFITDIDPLKYGLIFERFLNPERISMPDIDIDFCDERRDEVKAYVARKYGSKRVAEIVTFGTLGARQVIRDVARALAISVAEADRIAKMMPAELKITIDSALRKNEKLAAEYQNNPNVHRLIDFSRALEGLPRHASTHAAGMVVSEEPINEHVPLMTSTKGEGLTTQYPMKQLEEMGLLKMDFLGLRTLTVIRDAVEMVQQRRGIKIDIDALADGDAGVYGMIGDGDVDGVFQLESGGMRGLMQELKPKNLGEVMAGISLFRPGPMESIPEYKKNRKNPKNIKYAHPMLKPILEETYGVIVYQEQIMQIARDVAGYSMAGSDLIRYAMSKKKHDILERERKVFVYGDENAAIDGALKRGMDEFTAQALFDRMMAFADYAFNKSHACAYAVVTYQTAYLKRYYPVEFMCALLNSFIKTKAKLTGYIQAAKKMGIKLLPPDINKSQMRFTAEGDAIRYGFSAIANVGGALEEAVKRRRDGYEDFFDFLSKNADVLNKKRLECLVLSGCFDFTGAARCQLAMISDSAMAEAANRSKKTSTGQISLFDTAKEEFSPLISTLPDVPEYSHEKLLSLEKEMTGLYISGHPLDIYIDALRKSEDTITGILQTVESEIGRDRLDGKKVRLLSIITDVKQIKTKNGDDMARVTIEDMASAIDAIVFPKLYASAKGILKTDAIISMTGKVSITPAGEAEILAENIELYDGDNQLYVRLKNEEQKDMLIRISEMFPGTSSIIVKIEQTGRTYKMAGGLTVRYTEELLRGLRQAFGENNVKLCKK